MLHRPETIARALALLELGGHERLLVVGAGSGTPRRSRPCWCARWWRPSGSRSWRRGPRATCAAPCGCSRWTARRVVPSGHPYDAALVLAAGVRARRASSRPGAGRASRAPHRDRRSGARHRRSGALGRVDFPQGRAPSAQDQAALHDAPCRHHDRDADRHHPDRGWLRNRGNWLQLIQFGMVGVSGFALNTASTCCAARRHAVPGRRGRRLLRRGPNNFLWNRLWTFRHQAAGSHAGFQAARFFALDVGVPATRRCSRCSSRSPVSARSSASWSPSRS